MGLADRTRGAMRSGRPPVMAAVYVCSVRANKILTCSRFKIYRLYGMGDEARKLAS